MASTTSRKGATALALSEDSVEQEYGGDYSEASLEVIRALGPKKGAPFAELDPAERAAAQPPSQAECDAAKAQLEAYKKEIDALKNTRLSERERAAIDARRSLVLDATPEELTWLKMKEYYAAQRAAAAAGASSGAASTSASADAGAGAAAGDDVAALRAELVRLAMEALGSATETDELEARAASHLAAATSGRTSSSIGRGGGAAAPAEAGASAAALAAAADAAVAAVMAGTSSSRYREDYLEEERLTRQVARQRGQRSQAFALSLAAAVGVSVARWWLRRGRGNGGAAAGAGGGSGGPSRSRSAQVMQ